MPQLVFSLSAAPIWCSEHAGFDFKTFYETVIDFSKAVPERAIEKSAECKKLLAWWTK